MRRWINRFKPLRQALIVGGGLASGKPLRQGEDDGWYSAVC